MGCWPDSPIPFALGIGCDCGGISLGGLDRESVGEVKGSVRRLETNMGNSTKYYLVKLNSLYKRVAALEVEINNSGKQLLVAPEVHLASATTLFLLNWCQLIIFFRLPRLESIWSSS